MTYKNWELGKFIKWDFQHTFVKYVQKRVYLFFCKTNKLVERILEIYKKLNHVNCFIILDHNVLTVIGFSFSC